MSFWFCQYDEAICLNDYVILETFLSVRMAIYLVIFHFRDYIEFKLAALNMFQKTKAI